MASLSTTRAFLSLSVAPSATVATNVAWFRSRWSERFGSFLERATEPSLLPTPIVIFTRTPLIEASPAVDRDGAEAVADAMRLATVDALQHAAWHGGSKEFTLSPFVRPLPPPGALRLTMVDGKRLTLIDGKPAPLAGLASDGQWRALMRVWLRLEICHNGDRGSARPASPLRAYCVLQLVHDHAFENVVGTVNDRHWWPWNAGQESMPMKDGAPFAPLFVDDA